MNFIMLLFTVLGIFLMAYGLRVILKRAARVYSRRGGIRDFEGQSAQLVGIGIAAAGLGAILFGLTGLGGLIYGLLGAVAYFVMANLAERR